jgi:predicted esterase
MQQHHFSVPRTARYFTLGTPGKRVRQVWFACHGYGVLAHQFLEGFRPLDDGTRLVVAPEGLSRYYTDHEARQIGASWMTSEDRAAEVSDYVRYLDALYRHIMQSVSRDAVSFRVLGFSQGAATAARWISLGSATADRLILWGQMPPPDLDLEVAWGKLEDSRLTLVVGTRDPLLDHNQVEETEARLMAHDIPYETIRYNGGHRLDERVLASLAS